MAGHGKKNLENKHHRKTSITKTTLSKASGDQSSTSSRNASPATDNRRCSNGAVGGGGDIMDEAYAGFVMRNKEMKGESSTTKRPETREGMGEPGRPDKQGSRLPLSNSTAHTSTAQESSSCGGGYTGLRQVPMREDIDEDGDWDKVERPVTPVGEPPVIVNRRGPSSDYYRDWPSEPEDG